MVHLNKIELRSKLIYFTICTIYMLFCNLAESVECDDLDRSLLGCWYQTEDTDN